MQRQITLPGWWIDLPLNSQRAIFRNCIGKTMAERLLSRDCRGVTFANALFKDLRWWVSASASAKKLHQSTHQPGSLKLWPFSHQNNPVVKSYFHQSIHAQTPSEKRTKAEAHDPMSTSSQSVGSFRLFIKIFIAYPLCEIAYSDFSARTFVQT